MVRREILVHEEAHASLGLGAASKIWSAAAGLQAGLSGRPRIRLSCSVSALADVSDAAIAPARPPAR